MTADEPWCSSCRARKPREISYRCGPRFVPDFMAMKRPTGLAADGTGQIAAWFMDATTLIESTFLNPEQVADTTGKL